LLAIFGSLHKKQNRPLTLNAQPPARETMESINIVVIGANGVGKSHFIQKALSLTRTPSSQPSTARINIDHVPYAVTLFELDLEYFDVDPDRQIQWPRQVGGAMMPAIHGVLLLYDVMNRESIIELPQTLSECCLPKYCHENGDAHMQTHSVPC
jgi:GTPase SAR1 family protein